MCFESIVCFCISFCSVETCLSMRYKLKQIHTQHKQQSVSRATGVRIFASSLSSSSEKGANLSLPECQSAVELDRNHFQFSADANVSMRYREKEGSTIKHPLILWIFVNLTNLQDTNHRHTHICRYMYVWKKADIQIHIFKVNQRLLTKTRVNQRRRRLRRRLSTPAGKFSFILFSFFLSFLRCVLVSVIVGFLLLCMWGVWLCLCVCVYLCLPIDTGIYFGSIKRRQ